MQQRNRGSEALEGGDDDDGLGPPRSLGLALGHLSDLRRGLPPHRRQARAACPGAHYRAQAPSEEGDDLWQA